MTDYWTWWILAALLVGAELVTGTFYLLAVGSAFAVGGVAALLGVGLPLQLVVAGVVAVAATMVAHKWRGQRVPPPTPSLDLGQTAARSGTRSSPNPARRARRPCISSAREARP
jgi:membrane protein implicated in regulation of membrane protease activity